MLNNDCLDCIFTSAPHPGEGHLEFRTCEACANDFVGRSDGFCGAAWCNTHINCAEPVCKLPGCGLAPVRHQFCDTHATQLEAAWRKPIFTSEFFAEKKR